MMIATESLGPKPTSNIHWKVQFCDQNYSTLPVNNCDNVNKTTSFMKPVVTQAVSETGIVQQSLKTVCTVYLATGFNDTNMTLLQGLGWAVSWLGIGCHSQNSKPLLTIIQACISTRQCWRWDASKSRVHQCHHLPRADSIPNICKLLELKETAECSFCTMNRVNPTNGLGSQMREQVT